MQNKKLYVTKDGLKKIESELEQLKTTKRREIAERISEAKELGDLSENAEYIEAKEEQGFVESRIMELEQMLKNTEIIKPKKQSSVVEVGSTLIAKDSTGNKLTYTIVGSSEADPINKLISNESPLGSSFLGKSVGDIVNVVTPNGDQEFEILEIS